jgi:hypothetical protein
MRVDSDRTREGNPASQLFGSSTNVDARSICGKGTSSKMSGGGFFELVVTRLLTGRHFSSHKDYVKRQEGLDGEYLQSGVSDQLNGKIRVEHVVVQASILSVPV